MQTDILQPYELPDQFTPHRINGLYALDPGKSVVLADITGAGCINRFFITMQPRNLRQMVLRIWWDDEAEPSVECPVSDFFGIGHDQTTADFSSAFFYIAPRYGYNCYVPMPFGKRARIVLTNEGQLNVAGIYPMIEFSKFESLDVPWRFHMAWRRVFPAYRRGQNFTLLEAKGDGRLIGVIYHVIKRDSDDRWSHGGGDQIFIDGDTAKPGYIYGIGGEDFAHHAWGLYPGKGPFSGCHECHPLPGVKRGEGVFAFEPHGFEQHDGGRYSMYRFFVPDPIPFRHSVRMTFGTAANEISATTYWYQTEPHMAFSKLAPPDKRTYSVRILEDETLAPLPLGQSIPVAVLGPIYGGDDQPWQPALPVKLDQTYTTNLKQPYGDVVKPPYEIRWRRSEVRAGFLDLAAIHRPKCNIRARGLWNKRHLPLGSWSYQLIRLTISSPRNLTLRLGYEDKMDVWLTGTKIAALHRPEPDYWRTDDVALTLAAGTHDLVLAHSQDRWARWSAWSFYAKFLEADGSIAEGLTFDPFESLDATPEKFREAWPPEEPIDTDDYRDPAMLV